MIKWKTKLIQLRLISIKSYFNKVKYKIGKFFFFILPALIYKLSLYFNVKQ